ncbi:MAG: substrate-binding domain-containing protein, partial [Campylobacterota bacterium]
PVVQVNKQAKQLLNAIEDDTDYLIFTLDVNKHTSFIDRIISQGKPKLILQNITTPLRRWKNNQPFLYVGFDHFIGSKLIANELIAQTNGSGKYAVIHGAPGYVSYMRGTKFIDYISKNSNLQLAHEYFTKVIKENAKKATVDLLKIDDDIEFIYACRTNVAFGVVEALEQEGYLGKIKVNGWGGGANEIELMRDNKIDLTVMRMNDENAIAMAEAIKLDLENKTDKVPTIYSGSFELITNKSDEKRIEEFKKRAFRYSDEENLKD